jgi:hypothetical protein
MVKDIYDYCPDNHLRFNRVGFWISSFGFD